MDIPDILSYPAAMFLLLFLARDSPFLLVIVSGTRITFFIIMFGVLDECLDSAKVRYLTFPVKYTVLRACLPTSSRSANATVLLTAVRFRASDVSSSYGDNQKPSHLLM